MSYQTGVQTGDGLVRISYAVPVAPTTTGVSCAANPVAFGSATTCTATVTNTGATPSAPSGTITLATSGAGSFAPASSTCTLAPGAGSGVASCTVSYTPAGVGSGSESLTASYGGDSAHAASMSGSYTLAITPEPATLTLDGLSQTYDGTAKSASASVSPASCGPVSLAYSQNGSPVGAPISAGSYAVQASLGNSNCTISSGGTGTLVIAPAQATVTLDGLSQTYDGTAKAAGVTTTPAGLNVAVTYNGASAAPTNAGAYTVVATVSDPNYQGSASGTLTINPAAQAIGFTAAPPSPANVGATYTVAASGGVSGNPITFSAGPSSVCTSSGTNGATIALVGAGTCTVTASQAGSANGNYSAAPSVQQSFAVVYPPLYLTLGTTSSPSGPITTGSVVTVTGTLANHSTAAEKVTLTATFSYISPTGQRSTVSATSRAVTLAAGQTLGQPFSFTMSKNAPRGAYAVVLTATDTAGDTTSGSVALTVV